MPFRSLKVRMFYSKSAFRKKETPEPFLELRVWIISEMPITFPEEFFDEVLNRMEFIFYSVREARQSNAIFFIEGKEANRRIDEDEALEYLKRTGLKRPKYDEPYRQAHFWLARNREVVYNEADIREIEEETFNLEKYVAWRRSYRFLGAFAEDVKGLSLEEMETYMEGLE